MILEVFPLCFSGIWPDCKCEVYRCYLLNVSHKVWNISDYKCKSLPCVVELIMTCWQLSHYICLFLTYATGICLIKSLADIVVAQSLLLFICMLTWLHERACVHLPVMCLRYMHNNYCICVREWVCTRMSPFSFMVCNNPVQVYILPSPFFNNLISLN